MKKRILPMFLIIIIIMLVVVAAEGEETILVIGDSFTSAGKYTNVLQQKIEDGKKVAAFGQRSIDCPNMIAIQGGAVTIC